MSIKNDINIDFADFQTILSYEGKIDGFVGSFKVDKLISSLSENLKLSLKNARGVWIELEQQREVDSPMTMISSIMEELYNLINEDAEVIVSIKQNDIFDKDIINFKIIITGIMNSK